MACFPGSTSPFTSGRYQQHSASLSRRQGCRIRCHRSASTARYRWTRPWCGAARIFSHPGCVRDPTLPEFIVVGPSKRNDSRFRRSSDGRRYWRHRALPTRLPRLQRTDATGAGSPVRGYKQPAEPPTKAWPGHLACQTNLSTIMFPSFFSTEKLHVVWVTNELRKLRKTELSTRRGV